MRKNHVVDKLAYLCVKYSFASVLVFKKLSLCPLFSISPKCSSSCGTGMQIRSVECVDLNGIHNTQCDPATRPNSMQSCSVGIPCIDDIITMTMTTKTTEFYQELPSSEKSNINDGYGIKDSIDRNFDDLTAEDESEADDDDNGGERDNPPPSRPKVIVDESENNGEEETEEDEDEDDRMQADGPIERNSHRNLQYNQYRIPRAERLIDPHMPNEPT